MASQLLRQAALAHTTQTPTHQHWTQEEIERYRRDTIAMERKNAQPDIKYGNSNWQQAAWAARYAPPPLCPVVVGDRSFFKRPEDLSSFLGAVDHYPTSTVPELDDDLTVELSFKSEITATDIISKLTLPNVLVCGVYVGTRRALESLTKGEFIHVWFQDQTIAAWLPTALREMRQPPSVTNSASKDHAPADGQFPILISNVGGHGSMFETAEDLRDFLNLSEIPDLVQTTATNVESDGELEPGQEQPHLRHYPSRLVAFVDTDQRRELQRRTIGANIIVWFPDNIPRYAWAPRHVADDESEEENEDVADNNTQDTSNTAVDTSALSNESSTSDEYHDLEKQKEKQQVKAKSPQCALWGWVSGMYQKVMTKLRH